MGALSMSQALAKRDAGISSSAENAEQDAPGWGERAYQAIAGSRFLAMGTWTMEEARYFATRAGLDEPEELRSWGSVTLRLIRDGIIEPVGYARAASSNGGAKRTYRLRRASL